MYRGSSKQFKVMYLPDKKYAIWHADAPETRRWENTGHTGSELECWDYVEAVEETTGFIFCLNDPL